MTERTIAVMVRICPLVAVDGKVLPTPQGHQDFNLSEVLVNVAVPGPLKDDERILPDGAGVDEIVASFRDAWAVDQPEAIGALVDHLAEELARTLNAEATGG